MAAKASSNGKPAAARGRVRDDTIARLEASMGALGTAAMLSMDRRLPWFRSMSAENRSWLGLVAQAGVAAFVDWVKHPERTQASGGRRGLRHRAARAGEGRNAPAGRGDGAGHRRRGRGPGRRAGGAGRRGGAARGRAPLHQGDRVRHGPGVRADRRGSRRLGRPARGPGRGVAGPRRGGRGPAVLGVGAELVLQPGHGDRRDRRRRAPQQARAPRA